MFSDYPLVICAGGASIPYPNNSADEKLKELIENNISIGLNYFSHYYCDTTWTSFVDSKFYKTNEWLDKIPLIIGKSEDQIKEIKSNTLLLPRSRVYFGKDSWLINKERCLVCKLTVDAKDKYRRCPNCKTPILTAIGFYHHHFATLFALTLGIALGFKDIYILGLDGKDVNGKTHFYQDQISDFKKYHGIGKVGNDYRCSTYNNVEKTNNWYYPYTEEKEVNIYNVSPESTIYHLPKIDYDSFYSKINKQNIDQNQIREEIKTFIKSKLQL